jgi:V8-like Glu-specific endopeptidase
MKLSHILLLSTSLIPFHAHAMESDDIQKNFVRHPLVEQSYTAGTCDFEETDKYICISHYKPKKKPTLLNLIYMETPEAFPHENRLDNLSNAKDERLHIENTTVWPHVLHSQLSLQFSNKKYGGSGTVIGPHHILTTASNVYNPRTQEWATNIVARIALNKTVAPFGEVKGATIFVFKQWVEDGDPDFDIALVTLSESIGDRTGWAGLLAEEDSILMQKDIHVSGYHADKKFNQLWTMVHHIKGLKEESVFFKSSSYEGKGGGSSWINQYGIPYVIGIHTLGGGDKYGNRSGVRLSKNKLKVLKEWISSTWEIKQPSFSFKQPSFGFPSSSSGGSTTPSFSFGSPKLNRPTTAETASFEKWKKGLSDIDDQWRWASVLLRKCTSLDIESLDFNKKFSFQNDDIGTAGVESLSNANLSNLKTLGLQGNKIGDDGVKTLSVGNFSNLTSLNLSYNNIGDIGAEYFSKGNFSNLTSLELNGNNILNNGAKFLSNANLSNLTSLNLNNNKKLGFHGVKSLSKGNLSNLTSLNLSDNNIGDIGVKALSVGNFSNLTSLELNDNNIGPKGAEFFSMSSFSNLTSLELNDNNIETKGAEFLSKGNLSNLTSLNLKGNKIGDDGAKSLSKGNLSNLTSLNLNNNDIRNDGVKALSVGNFSNLTSLNLGCNTIGAEEKEVLSKKIGLNVVFDITK